MGVNNDNPCPICGSVYSEYAGEYLSTCRGCGNTFDAKEWKWHSVRTELDAQPMSPPVDNSAKTLHMEVLFIRDEVQNIVDGNSPVGELDMVLTALEILVDKLY